LRRDFHGAFFRLTEKLSMAVKGWILHHAHCLLKVAADSSQYVNTMREPVWLTCYSSISNRRLDGNTCSNRSLMDTCVSSHSNDEYKPIYWKILSVIVRLRKVSKRNLESG
jgi:hypothetical protein